MEAIPWLLAGILLVLVISNWSAISKFLGAIIGVLPLVLIPLIMAVVLFVIFNRIGSEQLLDYVNTIVMFGIQTLLIAFVAGLSTLFIWFLLGQIWTPIKTSIIISGYSGKARPFIFVTVWLIQLLAFVILYASITAVFTSGAPSWLRSLGVLYILVLGLTYYRLVVEKNLSLLEIVKLATDRLLE